MPKKRTKAAAASEPTTADTIESIAADLDHAVGTEADAPTTATAPTPPEPPAAHPPVENFAIPESADAGSPASGEGRRFRSWVVDDEHGYSRLTDDQHQRLVLQFAEKPSEDVLTALKGAGFHYQPEYGGLKNAWVRRNDYTGRLEVEVIERLLRAQSPAIESPER